MSRSYEHHELIKAREVLGFKSNYEGICNGLSGMWEQASLVEEEEKFYERLKLFFAPDFEKKYQDLEKKIAANAKLDTEIKKQNATPVAAVANKEDEKEYIPANRNLTDSEKQILDVHTFFSGAETYQLDPQSELSRKLFANIYRSHLNTEITSTLTGSLALEKQGGIRTISGCTGEFMKNGLFENYMAGLRDTLKQQSSDEKATKNNRHVIHFSGYDSKEIVEGGHAISLQYNEKENAWIVFDVNQMDDKTIVNVIPDKKICEFLRESFLFAQQFYGNVQFDLFKLSVLATKNNPNADAMKERLDNFHIKFAKDNDRSEMMGSFSRYGVMFTEDLDVLYKPIGKDSTPIVDAVVYHQIPMLEKLIKKHSIDNVLARKEQDVLDKKSYSNPVAVSLRPVSVPKMLERQTLIHTAAEYGHVDILEMFYKHSAKNFETKDILYPRTPLAYAVMEERKEAVNFLVSCPETDLSFIPKLDDTDLIRLLTVVDSFDKLAKPEKLSARDEELKKILEGMSSDRRFLLPDELDRREKIQHMYINFLELESTKHSNPSEYIDEKLLEIMHRRTLLGSFLNPNNRDEKDNKHENLWKECRQIMATITPAERAQGRTFAHAVAQTNNQKMMDAFTLKMGGDNSFFRITPMHVALRHNHLELIRNFFKNEYRGNGHPKLSTFAYHAAQNEKIGADVIKILSERGWALDVKEDRNDNTSKTPAKLAIDKKNVAVINQLLELKVDFSFELRAFPDAITVLLAVPDEKKLYPAHSFERLKTDFRDMFLQSFFSAMEKASPAEQKDTLNKIIYKKNAFGEYFSDTPQDRQMWENFQKALNLKRDQKDSLVHIAVKHGFDSVIKYCEMKKEDLFQQDKNGLPPAHLALQCGHLKVLQELLNRFGEKVMESVDAQRKELLDPSRSPKEHMLMLLAMDASKGFKIEPAVLSKINAERKDLVKEFIAYADKTRDPDERNKLVADVVSGKNELGKILNTPTSEAKFKAGVFFKTVSNLGDKPVTTSIHTIAQHFKLKPVVIADRKSNIP